MSSRRNAREGARNINKFASKQSTGTRGGPASASRHLLGSRGEAGASGALTGVSGVDVGLGGRGELSETLALRPTAGGGGGAATGVRTQQRVENTYRMDPNERHKFMSHQVEQLLKDILDAKLHNIKYDADNCSRLAKEVCSMIKDKTKEFEYSRYKLVTQVLLGQDTDQHVQIASRCLWNHETDNFAAATYRNNSLYAVAIVYGMYLD